MKTWWFFAALIIVGGCSEQPYPGYREVAPGLYMQLLRFDHETQEQDSCEVVEINIHTLDSLAASSLVQKNPDFVPNWYYTNDRNYNLISRYLKHLEPGDSALFIDLQPIFATSADSIVLALSYQRCYTNEGFREAFETWLSDREFAELERVESFADRNGYSASIVHPHVYCRTENTGFGKRFVYGDLIAIHYSGYFLTGQQFDDSRNHGQPLTFKLGQEGQVLPGLEYGVIGMHAGEKRSVLVPSALAFGEKGSSTGIVPPFTPLLFEVEALLPDTIS